MFALFKGDGCCSSRISADARQFQTVFTQPSACPVYSTVADDSPFGECRKWFVPPSSCVVSALAADDANLDVRAWTDLLTLPSLLPVAFVRGGR